MGTSVEEAYKRVQVDPFQSPSLGFFNHFFTIISFLFFKST